jgi:hypothetical protein
MDTDMIIGALDRAPLLAAPRVIEKPKTTNAPPLVCIEIQPLKPRLSQSPSKPA